MDESWTRDWPGETSEVGDPPPPTPAALARPAGTVRFLHLSPHAPPLDVIAAAGHRLAAGLPFGAASERRALPPGRYDLVVAPDEAAGPAGRTERRELQVVAGGSYTAAAFGPAGRMRTLALVNERAHIPPHRVRLRAVHAALGLRSLDVWLTVRACGADATAETFEWSQPLAPDLEFGRAGPLVDALRGRYTIGLDLDGDGRPDESFELPVFQPGQHVNVFVATDARGAPFAALDVT